MDSAMGIWGPRGRAHLGSSNSVDVIGRCI